MNTKLTAQDIAQKFNVSVRTAEQYLYPKSKYNSKTAQNMRAYATQNGYYATDAKCDRCGQVFELKQKHQHLCPECASYMKQKIWKHGKNRKFYHNGCFHSREEEQKRMEELRAEGYSNMEIAQKIGRDYKTVLIAIGYQPDGITKKNKIMGQKIRAQKNASRKQYVVNEQVTTYNNKVSECKQKQKELKELQKTVISMEKAIQKDKKRVTKLVQKTVQLPEIELPVVQIAQ